MFCVHTGAILNAIPPIEPVMSNLRVPVSIIAATLLASTASAHTQKDISFSCNASSNYQVSLSGQAFIFQAEGASKERLALGGGRLYINGQRAQLGAADQIRINTLESELRELVPESRKVTREAIAIAFDALTEVSVALSGDPGRRTGYDQARNKALRAANDSSTLPIFNERSMRNMVEPIVAEFTPDIMGSALGFAFRAIFAGEEKRKAMEARMDAMDATLDKRIEARADALEPLAEGMCKRIQRMNVIDDALEVRLPSGKPIDLLSVKTPE
jgi:hypothetical protein